MSDLTALSAREATRMMQAGELSAVEYVGACLARIGEREDAVQAWTHLDPAYAVEQAEMVDAARASGRPTGPLHGLPVGVKDIFDTADMPTENGSVLNAGRTPAADAHVVSRLRAAGAVIMGKTVTTEFAVYGPGKTRNPNNPEHTPGGSSSGSAAAVADGMVPLAIGTQTNGSVIRPASFCGCVGFKPTHGLISRAGALKLSRALDHVGVFARDVADASLLADVLVGHDENDPDTRPHAPLRLFETAAGEPPLKPRFAFVKTAAWPQADAEAHAAFSEFAEFLGDACDEIPLPAPFEGAIDTLATIMNADLAKNLGRYFEHGRERISDVLTGMIENGRKVLAIDYQIALDWREVYYAGLSEIFDQYDAILTPATLGTAPKGLHATGSPAFCSLWSLTGVPAVTLPLMQGENGLPIGIQLVGPRNDDGRLLRAARWLAAHVEAADA